MRDTEQDPGELQPTMTVMNLESGNLVPLVTIVCGHFFMQ